MEEREMLSEALMKREVGYTLTFTGHPYTVLGLHYQAKS
jgi:hypothetical protein